MSFLTSLSHRPAPPVSQQQQQQLSQPYHNNNAHNYASDDIIHTSSGVPLYEDSGDEANNSNSNGTNEDESQEDPSLPPQVRLPPLPPLSAQGAKNVVRPRAKRDSLADRRLDLTTIEQKFAAFENAVESLRLEDDSHTMREFLSKLAVEFKVAAKSISFVNESMGSRLSEASKHMNDVVHSLSAFRDEFVDLSDKIDKEEEELQRQKQQAKEQLAAGSAAAAAASASSAAAATTAAAAAGKDAKRLKV